MATSVLITGAGMQEGPAVTALSNGNQAVAWFDVVPAAGGGSPTVMAHARIVDASGHPVGAIIDISPPDILWSPNLQVHLAALAGGGFAAIWNQETAATVDGGVQSSPPTHVLVGQLFDAAGNPVGANFQVGQATIFGGDDPFHVGPVAGGGFEVDWPPNLEGLQGRTVQLYDANGAPAGAPFQTNVPLPATPSPLTVDTSHMQVTAMVDGGFLLSWVDPGGPALVAQRYDASGHAVGSLTTVASGSIQSTSGIVTLHDVAATPDGGATFAWEQANAGNAANPSDVFVTHYGSPIGGPGADVLVGTPGNDVFAGGGGTDLAVFTGARAQYVVTPVGDEFTVSGPDGTDTLTGVERLHFTDVNVALDIQGNGGMAYRLYRAAFDRAPDLGGLGFHIRDLDNGVTLSQVAAHFLESPEFQARYGGLDDAGFITQLYANVLHRQPDPDGLRFHLDELAHGQNRADMLTHFSESPENQAAVIGTISTGMAYLPD